MPAKMFFLIKYVLAVNKRKQFAKSFPKFATSYGVEGPSTLRLARKHDKLVACSKQPSKTCVMDVYSLYVTVPITKLAYTVTVMVWATLAAVADGKYF